MKFEIITLEGTGLNPISIFAVSVKFCKDQKFAFNGWICLLDGHFGFITPSGQKEAVVILECRFFSETGS